MKRNAFVITASHFGPMIVNRFDFGICPKDLAILPGVGGDILEFNEYKRQSIDACFDIIKSRYDKFGEGVVALDIGANIGAYALGWAHRMHEWGSILAIEAQERIFYALAGNVAINNCFNVQAIWGAAASKSGFMAMPELDHCKFTNFGGLSLVEKDLGDINEYKPIGKVKIQTVAIDDFKLQRVDFIKIDVQGMELDVLNGAKETISRCKPVIVIEKNFTPDEYCRVIPSYQCHVFDDSDLLMEPLD